MFGIVVGLSRLSITARTSYESFGVAKILKPCVLQELSQLRTGLCKIESRNYSNWRTFIPKKWSNTKNTNGQTSYIRPVLSTRPGFFQYFRNSTTSPFDFNTKVKNNVMLYRYEKPFMFKLGTGFAVMAVLGCFSMADLVYRVLCKGLWLQDKPWTTRLYEHIIPLAAIATGLIGGPLIAAVVIGITMRSIKYIILRKGGQEVTFVTYHPIRAEVARTVPLSDVSSMTTRDGIKAYVPIKIRGLRWKFICDKNGHFVNPELFDNTVGVRRFK